MASGRLGAVDLSATTNTLVCTGTASTISGVTVSICNRNTTEVKVRLAFCDGDMSSLSNEDYILYDAKIEGNGVVQIAGKLLASGHTIVAYSDTANVSVSVDGYEDIA